jgi:probable HAF family extracellular repeat protein
MRHQPVLRFFVAFALPLSMGIGVLPAIAASTPASYQVTDLGTVDFVVPNNPPIARKINDKSQVAANVGFGGGSFGNSQALIWQKDVGFTPCGDKQMRFAADINNRGQVVSNFIVPTGPATHGPTTHAAICHLGQVIQDLGVLPGGENSDAFGINDHTQVVGWASNAENQQHAALWDKPGHPQDLGVLTEDGRSVAVDINNQSQVVGYASTSDGQTHAFLWTKHKGMEDLGVLPGASDSMATAINNHGIVVGSSGDRAFLWDRERGMRALKSLPGAIASDASDINDKGQVVGTARFSSNSDTFRAFIWQAGLGATELPLLPGATSSEARGINNHGKVVGSSLHPVLWEPVNDVPEQN